MEVQRTGASMARGKSKQDYATPQDFRDAIVKRFGMPGFDLAASSGNMFADGIGSYFSEDADALSKSWEMTSGVRPDFRWNWLNPPFGNIAPWAEKCATESQRGARILFLVPASVGANWFQEWVVPHAHVIELAPRLCFDGKSPFPKDLVLAAYCCGLTGRSFWRWK